MSSAATVNTSSTSNMEKASYDFDPSISEEEQRFYVKAYPTVDVVKDRKVHCTICKTHIGTAPSHESMIKMHPVLRVTHCIKCHEFYNSGEFSKGEDGSELYCRWCGQGGEVYCCSNCPYVFCKSCIIKNLSRGVVADIEQNENWSCFSCAPKILWPLRAQHWALVHYIEKQKKDIQNMNLPDSERKQQMAKDRSSCCRTGKTKLVKKSDSVESLDSIVSRRSQGSSISNKKPQKAQLANTSTSTAGPPPQKRLKTTNDEVVCTPDLLSMLEPDCQITMTSKQRNATSLPSSSTPKQVNVSPPVATPQIAASDNATPQPLIMRNTSLQIRRSVPHSSSAGSGAGSVTGPGQVMRRTVVGSNALAAGGANISKNTPVYHHINGFRIDLNSAAQQETFRLPNGKLIQVKRQSIQHPSAPQNTASALSQRYRNSSQSPNTQSLPNYQSPLSNQSAIIMRRVQSPAMSIASTSSLNASNNVILNGSVLLTSGQSHAVAAATAAATATAANNNSSSNNSQPSVRNVAMVRQTFPDSQIGQARTQLQDQVFNAMDICQHLTGKVQTLTNSNAYKQARNYVDVKELYIHLSYLLTYAIGRFKGLQDKCLGDMRQLGFANDADSLENGQLAAGVDYVRYGQLNDVDLLNRNCNSFQNQVYEYRKSLNVKLDNADEQSDGEATPPEDPLSNNAAEDDEEEDEEESLIQPINEETIGIDDNDGNEETMDNEQAEESYVTKTRTAQRNYDRKLTRLVETYPAIWCTCHPNYGNFEVTRRQWHIIASHFKRGENIKLRWKNIRKRYVRIERRIREGKRFSGYFDKATNFLANRNQTVNSWIEVDRGENEDEKGEYEKPKQSEGESLAFDEDTLDGMSKNDRPSHTNDIMPIDITTRDLRIINFVKCNSALWQISSDAKVENRRAMLWMHLWKSMPNVDFEDIIDRWRFLYDMYKTFRLKIIKDERTRARLQLKYSKYLGKLYFLYKIDEEDLRNENSIADNCPDLDHSVELDKLQAMSDDKEFMQQLAQSLRKYRVLWNKRHVDYYDIDLREKLWNDIASKLKPFNRDAKTIKLRWQLAYFAYRRYQRDGGAQASPMNENLRKIYNNLPTEDMSFLDIYKQASDDEDNEIQIVEPKTDTITLDSDNEEEQSPSNSFSITSNNRPAVAIAPINPAHNTVMQASQPTSQTTTNRDSNYKEFMSTAQSILASLLDVDTAKEAPLPRQPRKKTTNKPNPKLLWQKKQLELQRLEDMKKMNVKKPVSQPHAQNSSSFAIRKFTIKLRRVESEYPYLRKLPNKNNLPEKHTEEVCSNIDLTVESDDLDVDVTSKSDELNDAHTKCTNPASSTRETVDILDTRNGDGEVHLNNLMLDKNTQNNDETENTMATNSDSVEDKEKNDVNLKNSKLLTHTLDTSKEDAVHLNTDKEVNENDVANDEANIELDKNATVNKELHPKSPAASNEILEISDTENAVHSNDLKVDKIESQCTTNENTEITLGEHLAELQNDEESILHTSNVNNAISVEAMKCAPVKTTDNTITITNKDELTTVNDISVESSISNEQQEEKVSEISVQSSISHEQQEEKVNEISVESSISNEQQEELESSKSADTLSTKSRSDQNEEQSSALGLFDSPIKITRLKENTLEVSSVVESLNDISALNKEDAHKSIEYKETTMLDKSQEKSEKMNVEEEFDVNEELEKLLKKVCNEKLATDIGLNAVDVELEDTASASNSKVVKAPTISTSPDLFNDINELIEQETNAMT